MTSIDEHAIAVALGVAPHDCGLLDEMDHPIPPLVAECGTCGAQWCDRCDPTHGPLCPTCHGRGYSTAEILPSLPEPERQTSMTEPEGAATADPLAAVRHILTHRADLDETDLTTAWCAYDTLAELLA